MKKSEKKKIYPILNFLNVKYYTKERQQKIKINHSAVDNLNTNYYHKYL